jgi:hypothetical protein
MEEIICSVCLDVINMGVNHTITMCSHHFHSSCFARCCKINSCPNCRATLFDDIPTNTDDYENDFNFPPIPEVVLINDERFFIGSDGFIYANIECEIHDRVATIYDNYDNTYTYEWLNTLYYNMGRPVSSFTSNNEQMELEDGEINETSEEEDSTEHDVDCLKKIEDELELMEHIYFIPLNYRL